ncbi:MAG: hypothetical protein EOP49_05720 [Sphingobacteriales bacterium]|nr:MAG: hypothetical protein EOP49_05720 [Sphingobacteriales bacterium]
MSKTTYLLITIFSAVFFGSCNKQGTDSVISGEPAVWGKLSAIVEDRKIISGADTLFEHYEIGRAEFLQHPDVPGIFSDAGDISINGIMLDRDLNNSYSKIVTELGIPDSLRWHVTGTSAIPNLSLRDTADFPLYTGPVPFEISKSAGYSILLDSTTLSRADSVRILIDDGGSNRVFRTYSARSGMIMISPADLSVLNTVTDQTGFIGIYPYGGEVRVTRGKGYFYSRESRIHQSININ